MNAARFDLSGHVALVTGGNHGIGAATARSPATLLGMAAKKSAKKTTRKTAGKAPKKAAKKAAKKTAAPKKAAAKKKAAAPKKAASKAPQKKVVAAKKAAKQKPAEAKTSSLGVNMGHVFALRPRVTTSFKPGDFNIAKLRLQDEAYADVVEAARAVVEKALELTHGGASHHQRRFSSGESVRKKKPAR